MSVHLMTTILASDDPIQHIVDKSIFDSPLMLSMVTLVVGAALVCWLLGRAAKAISTGPESMGNRRFLPSTKFGATIEVIVLYLRNDMLVPVMGERLTAKYLGFLLTLFFFILILNIIGLIPFVEIQDAMYYFAGKHFDIKDHQTAAIFGGAATASISVTAGLACITFVVVQTQGLKELGLKGWLEHLCGGSELVHGAWFLWAVIPIIFVVEFFGLFVKPAALAIRLFANMVAGHTLLLTVTMFGAMAMKAGLGTFAVGGITVVSGIGAIIITFLEVFVALLQAFIFMFLSAVFISLMAHEEHADHADHADDHGHAPHAEGAPAH